MGRDIHIRITKYNDETNKYEELCLYRPRNKYENFYYDDEGNKNEIPDPYIRASCYSGRNSEMFNGMKEGDDIDGYGDFPWYPVRLNSLEDSLKADIEKRMNTSGYYDFYEISLPEIAYYLEKHPKVADYDVEDKDWDKYWDGKGPKPEKTNPIQYLYDNIFYYIEFADFCVYNLNDYKVIFYFDC